MHMIRRANLTEVHRAEHNVLLIGQQHDTQCQQWLADTSGRFHESTTQRSSDGWSDIRTKRRDLDRKSGD